MGATEDIMKMAKENNCTVTTAMVVAAGISRGNLKYLVEKGLLRNLLVAYIFCRKFGTMKFLICRADLSEAYSLMRLHCSCGI